MNSESTSCPKCGCELPRDAPQGLCPRCLAALNFATETMPPDAAPVAPQSPLKPEELTPYFPQLEIIECLGRGGMGVVYKARQKSLNRLVALKLLAPERADDVKFAERFAKEAQALAALNHPHIVTIHDFGQAGGFYFLLMEFIDGVNLRQAMSAGRFTPEQALAIVPPVCEALQYAHEHSIVHRDIKPENLLLDKAGRVKIADFGIAKMLGTPHSDADPGDFGESRSQPFGTPAYAAPEQQSDPKHVDHRADIYSLGVVLYELLTGELPKDKLEPPSKRVQIDVRLDEVVLRALETRPEMRFATAAEFRTQLAEVVAKPASRNAAAPASPKPSRMRRWLGAAALVLGMMLLLGSSVLNEMVDDFGLTKNARKHLEMRRRAEQTMSGAKTAVADKFQELAAAKKAQNAPEIERLNREWEALRVSALQAESNLNQAAVLKQGDEKDRIAIFYLIAGGLIAAGLISCFHRPRAGTGQRRVGIGIAGILCAWALAAMLMHWRNDLSTLGVDPERIVDRITVIPVAVENNVCVVDIAFTVTGAPVEMRALLDGKELPVYLRPKLDDASRNMSLSSLVVAGAPRGNQPWRLFQPGAHRWRLRFVLPTEETARNASKGLRSIGPMRVIRDRAHQAVLFEIDDGSGGLYRATLEIAEMQTAAHPRWVSITGARNWNDLTLSARWTVSANQPGMVRLDHAGGRQSANLEPNGSMHEAEVRVDISPAGTGRVLVITQIGGSQNRREISNDFISLRDEVLGSALNSAKTETGTSVGLCRMFGKQVTLELPFSEQAHSTTISTPQQKFGIGWSLFALQLLVLFGVFGGVAWMIRAAFKSGRTGCALVLIVLLGMFLLLVAAAATWILSYRALEKPVSTTLLAVSQTPTAWEARLQEDLQKLRQEKATLGKTLGAQHPQIKAIDEQITVIETEIEKERRKPVTGMPAFASADPRFFTTPGTRQLNQRYTLNIDARALKGQDGSSSMRSYTLKDKLEDGTKGVARFAPLAIQNELFIVFWDRDPEELWLASPTILRRHHLPEIGSPSDQVFIKPEVPDAFKQRMPEPFRKAVERWHFTEDRPANQPMAMGEKALTDVLKRPGTGTFSLIATLTREHYFESDVPNSAEMECFRVSAGESKEHVFLNKNSPVQQSLREQLPWGESDMFTVTMAWRQQGAKMWLELLGAKLF
jgi:serine/threonine protein kinase